MNIGKVTDLPKDLYGEVASDGKSIVLRTTNDVVHTIVMGTLKSTRSNFTYKLKYYEAVVEFIPGVGADSEVTLRIYEFHIVNDKVETNPAVHIDLVLKEPGQQPFKDFLTVEPIEVPALAPAPNIGFTTPTTVKPIEASEPVPVEEALPTTTVSSGSVHSGTPKHKLLKELLHNIPRHVIEELKERWPEVVLFTQLDRYMRLQSMDEDVVKAVEESIERYVKEFGTDDLRELALHLLIDSPGNY